MCSVSDGSLLILVALETQPRFVTSASFFLHFYFLSLFPRLLATPSWSDTMFVMPNKALDQKEKFEMVQIASEYLSSALSQ